MDGVELRPIPGYFPYVVSASGEVWNNSSGKQLSSHRSSHGYLVCGLTVAPRKQKSLLVQRLVALAWLPPDPDPTRTSVNHLNGDRKDNRVENLEWVSPKENTAHAVRTGLLGGKSKKGAPIESTDCDGIVTRYQSIAEAARAVQCSAQSISIVLDQPTRNIKGKTWHRVVPSQIEGEEWRPLREYRGSPLPPHVDIDVSSMGRMRRTYDSGPRISPPYANGLYLEYSLPIGPRGHITAGVSNIIAEAFLGPRPTPDADVDHVDGNTMNNCVANLRYLSRADHCTKTVGVPCAQLSDEGEVLATFPSIARAAKSINVSSAWMAKTLVTGKRCGGFLWKRAEPENEPPEEGLADYLATLGL